MDEAKLMLDAGLISQASYDKMIEVTKSKATPDDVNLKLLAQKELELTNKETEVKQLTRAAAKLMLVDAGLISKASYDKMIEVTKSKSKPGVKVAEAKLMLDAGLISKASYDKMIEVTKSKATPGDKVAEAKLMLAKGLISKASYDKMIEVTKSKSKPGDKVAEAKLMLDARLISKASYDKMIEVTKSKSKPGDKVAEAKLMLDAGLISKASYDKMIEISKSKDIKRNIQGIDFSLKPEKSYGFIDFGGEKPAYFKTSDGYCGVKQRDCVRFNLFLLPGTKYMAKNVVKDLERQQLKDACDILYDVSDGSVDVVRSIVYLTRTYLF